MRIKLRDGECFKTFSTEPGSAMALAVPVEDISRSELGALAMVSIGVRKDRLFELGSHRRIVERRADGSIVTEQDKERLYAVLWPVEGDEGDEGREWWQRYGRLRALADTALQLGDDQAIRLFDALLEAGYPKTDDPFEAARLAMGRWAEAFEPVRGLIEDGQVGYVRDAVGQGLTSLGVSLDPFEAFNVEAGIPALAQYARRIVDSLPKAKTKADEGDKRTDPGISLFSSRSLSAILYPRSEVETLASEVSISSGSEKLATIHKDDWRGAAPTADLAVIRGALARLQSLNGVRLLLHWIERTHEAFHNKDWGGALPPIRYEGGIPELADKAGCGTSRDSIKIVRDICEVAHAIRVEWRLGKGSLISMNEFHHKDRRRTPKLIIYPHQPLWPNHAQGFDRARQSEREGRWIVPAAPLPELSGNDAHAFFEAVFWLRINELMIESRDDVRERGGVLIDERTIESLLTTMGFTGSRAPSASYALACIARYAQDSDSAPAALESVGEGRFLYADNERYGRFRKMISEASGAAKRKRAEAARRSKWRSQGRKGKR